MSQLDTYIAGYLCIFLSLYLSVDFYTLHCICGQRQTMLVRVPGITQGPRMVRDVFRMAKENAPAIIFIDEVDAIATSRFDAQTGADRCVKSLPMSVC